MNDFDSIIKRITVTRLEPGDYTGEDGLLYCGKCHTPKQFRMEAPPLEGRLLPHPCRCEQERLDREAAEQEAHRHRQAVADLKRRGFTDPAMREKIGYLLWGGVGAGKSYLAGCIANALMEQEIAVRMTNFALILNDLTASFESRNEYISRLCRAPLLILDDFGMERGTEYGLEQVYNVIDSRYRSRRPLIVTTNLSLQDLQHPQDTAHARIYDRLLEMCGPIRFTGENFRRATAQDKLARLKNLME